VKHTQKYYTTNLYKSILASFLTTCHAFLRTLFSYTCFLYQIMCSSIIISVTTCHFWYEIIAGHESHSCIASRWNSVFQPFQWRGILCSNCDCSRNPCLFLGGAGDF